MTLVFADTLYWVAIARPNDSWTAAARAARARIGEATLLTTDEVLIEFVTALSRSGMGVRRTAAAMVRAIRQDSGVCVVEQSRAGFDQGLSRYERRADKTYSLTDCISMNVMEEEGVRLILTNDHHFTQEGFDVLIHNA
jgi:predicted nucleic acid-binding protein